jgi:hypothetical protein
MDTGATIKSFSESYFLAIIFTRVSGEAGLPFGAKAQKKQQGIPAVMRRIQNLARLKSMVILAPK